MVGPARRRSKGRRALNVWINGQLAGTWRAHKNRQQEFQYADAWLRSPHGRMLTLSMPFRPGNLPYRGDVVEHFFDNLLPDSSEIRRRIQRSFGISGASPFDLLAEIGRDCAGAIQLLPEDGEPAGWNRIEARPLTEAEVERHLKAAAVQLLPGEAREEFRISIAGAQEKTALLWHNEQWHAPVGATPTTHIMKLPLGLVGHMRADMSTSIENEWLCSRIMAAYGIETAHCDMARFGETKALVVRRFDRKLSARGDYWLRLPQEDMCQALGMPPSLKYESDGGPGDWPTFLNCCAAPAGHKQIAGTSTRPRSCSGCLRPRMDMPRTSASSLRPATHTARRRFMICSQSGQSSVIKPTT